MQVQHGATFIEVLIALMLFSITVTIVTKFMLYSTQTTLEQSQWLMAEQIINNATEHFLAGDEKAASFFATQAKALLPHAKTKVINQDKHTLLQLSWLTLNTRNQKQPVAFIKRAL